MGSPAAEFHFRRPAHESRHRHHSSPILAPAVAYRCHTGQKVFRHGEYTAMPRLLVVAWLLRQPMLLRAARSVGLHARVSLY